MSALGLALLSNTLFAAAMCLIAEIIRRFRRPALAHAIWALALLKLVTPSIWQLHVRGTASVPTIAPITHVDAIAPTIAVTTTPPPSMPIPHTTPAATPRPAPPAHNPWSAAQILLAFWCGGAVALLGITLVRIIRFHRALRFTQPAPETITAEIQAIAHRFGTTPIRARLATDICPMIWFLGLRPLMLLPRSILTMDAEQRAAILAHELAHLRRGDHWVRLLELFTTIALWWHPLVWLARYRLREAEEEACDAWVLWAMPHAGKTYAQTLVDMVRLRAGNVPAGASGLGGFGQLQRRLIMILEKSPRKSIGLTGWIFVALLAASLPLTIARASGSAKSPATQPQAATVSSDATSTAVRGLLEVCADKNPDIRMAAWNSICFFGPKAIPTLVEGMRDPATSDAAKALLSGFGPKAIDPLIAELHAKDRTQRLNALQALQSIIAPSPAGPGFNPARGPGVTPVPGTLFAPAGGGFGRVVSPQAGPESNPQNGINYERIDSAIVEVTHDPDAEIRRLAAAMLGSLSASTKDDSAIDRLVTLLDDEDKQVRQAAADSLGMNGPKAAKAVDALAKLTADHEGAVRAAAIAALGGIGPGAKNATATVAKALKDTDPQVRLVAASALGRMNAAE